VQQSKVKFKTKLPSSCLLIFRDVNVTILTYSYIKFKPHFWQTTSMAWTRIANSFSTSSTMMLEIDQIKINQWQQIIRAVLWYLSKSNCFLIYHSFNTPKKRSRTKLTVITFSPFRSLWKIPIRFKFSKIYKLMCHLFPFYIHIPSNHFSIFTWW